MSTNPTPIWNNTDVGVPNEVQQNPDIQTTPPVPPAMAYQKTGQAPVPITQRMIAPGGTVAEIPVDNSAAALKSGFKMGVEMTAPGGTRATIPMDQAEEAVKAGFKTTGPKPALLPVNTITGGAAGGDIGSGVIKGAGETTHSLGRIVNAITGDHIGSLPTSFDEPDYLQSQSGSETAGKVGENIAEFALGDEALKGLNVASRIGIAGKLLKLSQDSPYIARLLEAGVNATRYGIVGSGQGKLHGASNEDALTRGAETGLAGGALDAVSGLANVPRGGGPSLVRQIRDGAGVAQPQAAQALRAGASGVAEDESVANNVLGNPSLRTTLEETIDNVQGKAKSAYRQIDQAAATDFKALNQKLANAEYQIGLSADGSPEEAKWELSRQNTLAKIADAKQTAINAGVDPKILAKADAHYTTARALQDLETKVFKNPNIISGNAAEGTPEEIDVDAAVKALQRLQDSTKYGAPRLEQALGKQGAADMLSELYSAQRAGEDAIPIQRITQIVGKYALYGAAGAAGYDAVRALSR